MAESHLAETDSEEPAAAEPAPNGGGSSADRLLTADEVGQMLGVSAAWVYDQSRAGRIPTVTLGRYRRYRRTAIEQWVAALER